MHNNIQHITDCFGCGMCSVICPKQNIHINTNPKGFFSPQIINNSNCYDCGLCVKVCAYLNPNPGNKVIGTYSASSKSENTLLQCSSGGIAYELAHNAILQGYHVIGVKYNYDTNQAEHTICKTESDLMETLGSKYIQSNTLSAFKKININQKYIVFGSPCQIASFRKYIKIKKIEQNFILVDFFCHGVPSYNLWNKYLETIGMQHISKVSFRTKINPITKEKYSWHDSFVIYIKDCVGRTHIGLEKEGDKFYEYFLSDLCLAPVCYTKCIYKMSSSPADIRIGDAWGSTYELETKGKSSVLTFSERGEDGIKNLQNITCDIMPIEIVTEGQMRDTPSFPTWYKLRLRLFKTRFSFSDIERFISKINKIKRIPSRAKKKIIRYTHHA